MASLLLYIIGPMMHPSSPSKKPLGLPTRGKTASNRLRRVDNFILMYEPSILTRTDGLFREALFVDLGYGFDPRTTLESAARFRKLNPNLPILGVEIDKERVEAARPFADDRTFFRLGGFNLPLQHSEQVRLVRAFNVLRQYEERDFIPAYETLAPYVLTDGLMIEGTSTPFGQVWSANLARKTAVGGWNFEALVFSTNFRLGFDAEEFQTILPKNYIHRMSAGEPIRDFFEAWKRAAAENIGAKAYGLRQWFNAAAQGLSARGYRIDLRKKWLTKGWLIWHL